MALPKGWFYTCRELAAISPGSAHVVSAPSVAQAWLLPNWGKLGLPCWPNGWMWWVKSQFWGLVLIYLSTRISHCSWSLWDCHLNGEDHRISNTFSNHQGSNSRANSVAPGGENAGSKLRQSFAIMIVCTSRLIVGTFRALLWGALQQGCSPNLWQLL